MERQIKIVIGSLLFLCAVSSCEEVEVEKEVPACIKRKIRKIKREDVQNPPAKVWEWKVDGKIYYFISSGCCDQPNYLYNDNCDEVCAPDGGFSGAGDGNCPEFNGPVEQTLVWEDDRE